MTPTSHLANVSAVTSQLLIGGDLVADRRTASRQIVELARVGVTHVVDCRAEWDDAEVVAEVDPTIGYPWHGIDDAGQQVPVEWFETGVSYVEEAMQDPQAVVLTHCHMGINRGPSLGYAVLLGLGWDTIEAVAAIRRARPIAAVAYAEDALRWHHQRIDADTETRSTDIERLRAWRRADAFDVDQVIRAVRTAEGR